MVDDLNQLVPLSRRDFGYQDLLVLEVFLLLEGRCLAHLLVFCLLKDYQAVLDD